MDTMEVLQINKDIHNNNNNNKVICNSNNNHHNSNINNINSNKDMVNKQEDITKCSNNHKSQCSMVKHSKQAMDNLNRIMVSHKLIMVSNNMRMEDILSRFHNSHKKQQHQILLMIYSEYVVSYLEDHNNLLKYPPSFRINNYIYVYLSSASLPSFVQLNFLSLMLIVVYAYLSTTIIVALIEKTKIFKNRIIFSFIICFSRQKKKKIKIEGKLLQIMNNIFMKLNLN